MEWFKRFLDGIYECKHHWLGLGKDEEKSVRIFNRVISWSDGGILHEAGQRHVEVVVSQLQLTEARSVSTPGGREEQSKCNESEIAEFSPGDAGKYTTIAARFNYLAFDRPGIYNMLQKKQVNTWQNPACTIGIL